jgi:ammonia channel protein AmtB
VTTTILDELEAGQLDVRARVRAGAQRLAARLLRRAGVAWRGAAAWKATPAIPGVAGMVMVSAAAGLAASYGGAVLGLAAGFGVLGAFLLRLDSRL